MGILEIIGALVGGWIICNAFLAWDRSSRDDWDRIEKDTSHNNVLLVLLLVLAAIGIVAAGGAGGAGIAAALGGK